MHSVFQGVRVRRSGAADARASSINPRSALFTASLLGNTFATSGSRTMTLVDWRMRPAYLPRSIFLKSDHLYDERIQSLSSDLPFFINFSFLFCRTSRANDLIDFGSLYSNVI